MKRTIKRYTAKCGGCDLEHERIDCCIITLPNGTEVIWKRDGDCEQKLVAKIHGRGGHDRREMEKRRSPAGRPS